MDIISTSDLLPVSWNFLADVNNDPTLSWQTHSGLARNRLERAMRRPHIARQRAAWTACQAARGSDAALLVSHLPRMSVATNVMRKWHCPSVAHIAFAFNFTDLPTARRRQMMARALNGTSEFVIFSSFEKDLYPKLFDFDPALFRFLPWAMETPVPGPVNPNGLTGDYLCAIGGEGRDYALLAQVMRHLPHIRMVIVARPYSVAGIEFPDNVQVFLNLPHTQTWRIAKDSMGLVIPLVSPETACGHITLVGAQRLSIPLVITESQGVADYVNDGVTARTISAGSAEDLKQALVELYEDCDLGKQHANAACIKAKDENDLGRWVEYLQDATRRFAE